MNKQFYLSIVGIFCMHIVFAQTNQGSRLTAMGNNGAVVKDVWGVAANPATISDIRSPTIQLSYQEHYFSNSIRNQALAFVLPINRQIFGLHLQRYGISEYYNIKLGIVATRQFGQKLAIGLRINYHQLKIDNYGVAIGISVDVGSTYQLSNELSFGFYFNNFPKESYRTKITYISIPSIAYIGISYRTSPKLLIASTMSKDDVAMGIDYQLIQEFSLRAGISLDPFTHYFGVGFGKAKFMSDFTFTKHPYLGYSPQLTIGYVF